LHRSPWCGGCCSYKDLLFVAVAKLLEAEANMDKDAFDRRDVVNLMVAAGAIGLPGTRTF
jgi:hypothetical protein